MNILELQKNRNDLIVEARSIFDAADKDKRDLSTDEKTKFDQLMDQSEARAAQIARLGKLEGAEVDLRTISVPATKPIPAGVNSGFNSFGEFLQAVARASDPTERIDPRLLAYRDREERAGTGMSEGIPADGGFLVQVDYVNELLKKTYDTSVIASRCRKIPVSANSNGIRLPYIRETSRIDGARWGGILAYWKGESITKLASQPDFGQIQLDLKKLTGLAWATDELLQDTTALGAFISGAFAEEFAFKLDHEILWGLGGGQPLGIMVAPCLVTQPIVLGQAINTILFENIAGMYARMWGKSRPNAVWLINQDIEPELYGLGLVVGVGGVAVYLPPGGLSAAPYGTIFGRPVIPCEQCSTLSAVGDIILADFSQYILIDKGGIQGASSIHVHFTQDETCFRFVYRVDGQPWWPAPLTPHSGSGNTLSPFVTLAVRP